MKLPAAKPQDIFSPNVFLLLIAAFYPAARPRDIQAALR